MASFEADPKLFAPGIRKLVEQAGSSPRWITSRLSKKRAPRYAVVVKPLLTSYDFLLTPTLGLVPMAIEDVPPFLHKPYGRYIQFVLPVSFARTPAVSIPAGLQRGIARRSSARRPRGAGAGLLSLAEQLEAIPTSASSDLAFHLVGRCAERRRVPPLENVSVMKVQKVEMFRLPDGDAVRHDRPAAAGGLGKDPARHARRARRKD